MTEGTSLSHTLILASNLYLPIRLFDALIEMAPPVGQPEATYPRQPGVLPMVLKPLKEKLSKKLNEWHSPIPYRHSLGFHIIVYARGLNL